jgi:hypothetical protein
MGTRLSSKLNSPIFCTSKLSPIWAMTPMQGPCSAAASGFGGSGFFAAGLAGVGLVGEGLAGEGFGEAVGAVCASAGCASASASHKATLRITFFAPLSAGTAIGKACEPSAAGCRYEWSIRLDRRNCNRKSARGNSARAPHENTSAQGYALRAFS